MVIKRYPYDAVLSYVGVGTFSSITGIWSEGTITTIGFICDIQPTKTQLSILSDDGIVIQYKWLIFSEPNTEFSSVPDGANLEFFSKDHLIKQLFEYQNHTEIKC